MGMIPFLVMIGALATGATDPVVLRLERLTNCGGWKVAIHQSGAARGELFNACHAGGPKRAIEQRSLDDHVSRLRKLVEHERFGELEERPEDPNPIVDDAACVIEVSFGSLAHRVTLTERQLTGKQPELESFRRIWSAVQRLIPEPEW
jgi:hypothetical protein